LPRSSQRSTLRGRLIVGPKHNWFATDKEILMPAYDYPPPVSAIFTLDEPALSSRKPYDYRRLGITEEHLGALARMSVDPSLDYAVCGDRPELVWAPVHAMRAMIQLGTEATIEPLARLLEYEPTADYDDMNDWFLEEIPEAFGKMGAMAIPRCAELLRDSEWHTHSRLAAAIALTKIAENHPETREQCVALFKDQLERFSENEPEWNGWLVAQLADLKAVEAASTIERAFAADLVDETIVGDWDEVQAKLGLRPPLSDEEYAEKYRQRRAAHGWLSPEDELSEEELAEEMIDDWDDSGDEAWQRLSADQDRLEEPPEPEDPAGMAMPEDLYTAEERRELAKHRNKLRKAAERAKARTKQSKKRET